MDYKNLIKEYQSAIAQARDSIIQEKDGTVSNINQEQITEALEKARKYNIQISNKVGSKDFTKREDEIDGIEETIRIHKIEIKFTGGK